MKEHYDFRNGVRGKFYKPDAVFRLPVYLDKDLERELSTKAEERCIDLSVLVNELLKNVPAKGEE